MSARSLPEFFPLTNKRPLHKTETITSFFYMIFNYFFHFFYVIFPVHYVGVKEKTEFYFPTLRGFIN